MNHDHNLPPTGSRLIVTSDGFRAYAPTWASLQQAYSDGVADGFDWLAQNSDFGHWGTHDYQRNGSTFINGWTNASNLAVGIGTNGMGYSRRGAIDHVELFASFGSSNDQDPNQALWQLIGWDVAQSGACNGP
jgi:hypothetical protein